VYGLDGKLKGSTQGSFPGADEPALGETSKEADGAELIGPEATAYRGLVARLNFLAQDRVDIRYATKEAGKWMAKPRAGHWGLVKRIGRYLKAYPRAMVRYEWQDMPSVVHTHVDSDWAGCKASCKSTSGGVASFGRHLLMAWSATQGVVALSSGEAELYAMVKGAANTLGLISLLTDFGKKVDGKVSCDASAAIGMVNRTGVGKLRHVRVQYLWLQGKVRGRELAVEKVRGEDNPADLLTKNVGAELIARHCKKIGVDRLNSRASTAPKLAMAQTIDVDAEEDRVRTQIRQKVAQWRSTTTGWPKLKVIG